MKKNIVNIVLLTVALTSSFNAFGVGIFSLFSSGWDMLSTKISLREIMMACGFYRYQKFITNKQEKRFATLIEQLGELKNQYSAMEKALDESLTNNSSTTTTMKELNTSVIAMKEDIDAEKNSLMLKQEKIDACIQQLKNIENDTMTDKDLAARVSKKISEQELEFKLLIPRLEGLKATLEQNHTALTKKAESFTQLTTQHKNLANEVKKLMETTEKRELRLKSVIEQELNRLKEALVKKEATTYISDVRNQEITRQIQEEFINKRKSAEDLVRKFAEQFDKQVTSFQDKANNQLDKHNNRLNKNKEKIAEVKEVIVKVNGALNISKLEDVLTIPKLIENNPEN